MENIIGLNNRISVQWSLLTTEGEPFGLDGYQLILRAFSGRGRTDITGVTISGDSNNVVSWVMEAKELHYTGFFSLSLVLMKGNVRFATVTYKDAFRVSSRFDDHCSCTQQIHLKSYVNVIHSVGTGDGINEIMIGKDGPYSPPAGSRRVTLPEYPSRSSLGLEDMAEQIDNLDERVTEIEEHGGGGSSVDWNQIQESGAKIAEIRIGEGSPVSVFAPQQVRSVAGRSDFYQAGTSQTVAPTGEWMEEEIPSDFDMEKPYLWKKTKTIYTDTTVVWSEPVCISVLAERGAPGAPGDETDTVYAMSDVSLPISVTILDNTPSQDDTFLPTFVFAYSDSTSVQTLTTRAIPSLSEAHRFRFKSVRKRVNGLWGAFSAPALDANYSVSSLTQEEIDAIKSDVQSAIEDDLSSAIARINSLETEFEGIEDDLGGITQTINEQTGRLEALEARTVWTAEGIAHIADVQIDAAEGTIKAWAAEKTEDMFTDAGITIDGVAATVENFADFYDTTGTLSSVHSRLDAAEAAIETAATTADITGAINDARTEWQAGDNAAIQSSVTKARYLMDANGNLLDSNGNQLYYKGSGSSAADRIYYNNGEYFTDASYTQRYTGTKQAASYPSNLAVGITQVEGMSFIRQTAGEIDISAITDGQAAQILLKAGREGQTDIVLDADVITFKGSGVFEDSASIQTAWIDKCQITDGTIENATITDCTIISDIKSANWGSLSYRGTGFYINAETGSILSDDGDGNFTNITDGLIQCGNSYDGFGEKLQISAEHIALYGDGLNSPSWANISSDNISIWNNGRTKQVSITPTDITVGDSNHHVVLSTSVRNIAVGTGSDPNTLYIEI